MYQLAQTDVRMRACDRTNKKKLLSSFLSPSLKSTGRRQYFRGTALGLLAECLCFFMSHFQNCISLLLDVRRMYAEKELTYAGRPTPTSLVFFVEFY